MKKFQRALPVGLATALLVSACGSAGGEMDPELPRVAVSLYPVEYLAGAIGGEHISLTNVVPPGAEPHDIELTMQDAHLLSAADVSIVLGGFQAAVDAAVVDARGVIDLAPVLDLQQRHGSLDPHFWLDPSRMIIAANVIADQLIAADPDHAEDYRASLERAVSDLHELDSAYASAFGACEFDTFVTGHAAFGYLADAYGLTEIAVAGIDPETEPSPAALAATRAQVAELGLPMVFAEPGETKIAEVLAGELGIAWGVLDPVEAVGADSTYLDVMYANLEALKEGLACR